MTTMKKDSLAQIIESTGKMPRILVTAGPTHEPIDRVRYLGNRSSGRMGLALAEAATARGWSTTLLLGPTHLDPPKHSLLNVLRFQTTADLQSLLARYWPNHDVLLMTAAVADYRPIRTSTFEKLKRSSSKLNIELEPTPDLLAQVAATSRPDQFLVGFALEPVDQLISSARDKLSRKGLHAIVANPLETMDSTHISATVLLRDGKTLSPAANMTKESFAAWFIEALAPMVPKVK